MIYKNDNQKLILLSKLVRNDKINIAAFNKDLMWTVDNSLPLSSGNRLH